MQAPMAVGRQHHCRVSRGRCRRRAVARGPVLCTIAVEFGSNVEFGTPPLNMLVVQSNCGSLS